MCSYYYLKRDSADSDKNLIPASQSVHFNCHNLMHSLTKASFAAAADFDALFAQISF